MVAKFVTIDGETMALVLARPNRVQHPQPSLSFPTEITGHPLSKFESRRTFSRSARYEMQYRVRLGSADEATEFRIWLKQQKDQTLAIPFSTDACRLTAAANIGATSLAIDQHPVRSGSLWVIMNSDASVYEIVTVSAVSGASLTIPGGIANNWPKGTAAYPLVFGRLNERPELDASTPSRAECDLQFKEASIFARKINQWFAPSSIVGAQIPNLSGTPLWDIQANFSKVLERTEAQIVFESVGFGREESKQIYGQPNARVIERTFVCRNRDEIARIEYLFSISRGNVYPFAVPTLQNDLPLASDVAAGASTIQVVPGEYSDALRTPHQGDPYLAFVEPSSSGLIAVDPVKIASVAGATLTTVQPVALAHTKAVSRLSFLLLARLVDSKLSWEYSTDGRATCTLKFIELPNEYSAPSPILKESFFGYMFVEASKYPRSWLFTSYEDQIVLSGDQGFFAGTYIPAFIGHKQRTRSLDLSAQTLELESGIFPGSPLNLFFPHQLEGPLYLYVIEGNVADLTEPVKVRFWGTVTKPKSNKKEAQVQLLGNQLEAMLPADIFSTVDNFGIFAPEPNGLDPADWIIAGTIAAISSTTINVTSAAANTLVTGDATYFNHGEIQIGTTPATFESRTILNCVPITGGVQVTINRPLIKTTATGGAIDLYPGYDGTLDQRASRFGAGIGHGGAPFAPDTSINIKAVGTDDANSAKK